jgi:gliding motility-associated-like protein
MINKICAICVLNLIAFSSHNIVRAQCSFDVSTEIIQHSTCISNGIVKVTLSGNEIDLSNTLIVLTNGESINEQSSENGHLFSTLPPGTYVITAQSVCKNTLNPVTRTVSVTISSEYEGLGAESPVIRNSLTCIKSGMITVGVRNGKPPYKLEITSKPESYTGETVFSASSQGSMQINNLPPGNYSLSISDDCAYSIPINNLTVGKYDSDFPSNPYDDYFYPFGCSQAFVNVNYLSNNANTYWNEYRDFYEVAITFDGTKNWTPATGQYYIDLSKPYKELYNSGAKAQVYLRLKGTECEQHVDEIQFSEGSSIEIFSSPERSCDNYNLNFYLSNENGMCAPFKWEIFDESNTSVAKGDNLNNFNTQTTNNLAFNKNYTIKVTDNNGAVISGAIYYEQDVPYITECLVTARSLFTYELSYDVVQICFPYKVEIYEIYDENSTLLTTIENVNYNFETISGLSYDKHYKIKIIDKSGNYTECDHFENSSGGTGTGNDIVSLCDDYSIRIDKPANIKTPYTWTVKDKNGNVFLTGSDTDELIHGLQYSAGYTVIFTDGVNTVTYSVPEGSFVLPAPAIFDEWRHDFQCNDFELRFMVENIVCYPYKLAVTDSEGKIIYDESGFMEPEYHSMRLEYNKDYTIKITDNKGVEIKLSYKLDKEYSGFSYTGDFHIPVCVSEAHHGYMRILGQLDAGTSVRFISGPQIPVHTDTVLTEYISEFYPFARNFKNYEETYIEPGEYQFEITDKCGEISNVTISYRKDVEVIDFSYTKDETIDICNGVTRIYPQGQIYENGTPATTWFAIEDSPVSHIIGQTINGNDPSSYFSLSTAGKYVIGIRRYQMECSIDTIVINYEKNSFGLSGRSSYVCEIGAIGHIRVQAKNGQLPYTYTLLNQDQTPVEGVAPNDTGAFEYGAYGDIYIVQVRDACGTGFPIEVKINTLDQTALLSGKTNYCKGETVELSCLLLGATIYEWSGPLGFSEVGKSISIPNATVEHSGEYTIKVKPAGCDNSFSLSITVTVRETPVPDAPNPYVTCALTNQRLSIKPLSDNHSIQWYTENNELLPDAPLISSSSGVDEEYVFYVRQTDEIYTCVSEATKVAVTIIPSPEKNAIATGWSCENANPEIDVTDIVAGYVYHIFADAGANDTIAKFVGTEDETISLTLPLTLSDNAIFYLQTSTAANCATEVTETLVEVSKLSIEPEKLPQYLNNVDYEQILWTNAVSPVFTLVAGYLPDGLSLSSSGTISGKVSSSGRNADNVFVVQVQDMNGCRITREYSLTGELFIPKVFTPNGDGINDIFMQDYKILILDRMGIEIFRGDNGWDGTYKGRPVANDIYFYKIEYVNDYGSAKILTGYVGVRN